MFARSKRATVAAKSASVDFWKLRTVRTASPATSGSVMAEGSACKNGARSGPRYEAASKVADLERWSAARTIRHDPDPRLPVADPCLDR